MDVDDAADGGVMESNFDSLNDGGIDIDWPERYDKQYEGWTEDVFRFEHFIGNAQKLIVASHLLQHKKWFELYNNPSGVPLPTLLYVKCQGKPGTGKSFVIMTLRNITRKIMKANLVDAASDPTGCAPTLIK
eukprot:12985487-Ditylum_brightwellii.AAC.1